MKDHVYKDEKEKLSKLRGFVGILPGKVLRETPPVFKEVYDDPEKWPVYIIRPKDGLDFNELLDSDELYDIVGEEARMRRGKYRTMHIRKLVTWENRKDQDGNEIPCEIEGGMLTERALRTLTTELQSWLIDIIESVSDVQEGEANGVKS